MLYTHDERRTTTLLYKNITLTLSFWKRVEVSLMCQKDKRRQGVKETYCPITSFSLDDTMLCYLQGLTSSLLQRDELNQLSPGWGCLASCGLCPLSADSPLLQAGTDARLTLTPIDRDPYVDICIYHFVTPTHFRPTT